MPRTCTVCGHPKRNVIDASLVEGIGTYRGLAVLHGVSPSALRRHRADHLPQALMRARSLDEIATAESLAEQVRALRDRTLRVLAQAEADNDSKTQLSAIRELRALAELEARGAERSATVIQISVVEQYVLRLIEIVREFVPPERLEAAIARIEHVVQFDNGDEDRRPLLTDRG